MLFVNIPIYVIRSNKIEKGVPHSRISKYSSFIIIIRITHNTSRPPVSRKYVYLPKDSFTCSLQLPILKIRNINGKCRKIHKKSSKKYNPNIKLTFSANIVAYQHHVGEPRAILLGFFKGPSLLDSEATAYDTVWSNGKLPRRNPL